MAHQQAAFLVGPQIPMSAWAPQSTGSKVQPYSRLKRAPFASFTLSSAAGHTPQLLFHLGRAESSASGSESDDDSSSSGGPPGDGGSSSGSSSSSEGLDALDTSEVETFQKVHCKLCKKPIIPAEHKAWGPWGSAQPQRHVRRPPSFLVCDGCQHCYHERCCEGKGMATEEGRYGWFHSRDCEECWHQLQQQLKKGDQPLDSSGRSWQLLDCRYRPRRGSPQSSSFKSSLADVLDLLLVSYGPGVAQQLTEGPRYALLLREEGRPRTAGLMDVYGQELAVLDFVSTDLQQRGGGHCRALLGAVEHMLGPGLGVHSLLAVMDPQDKDMVAVWGDKFGFKRLNQRQLRLLTHELPALSLYQEGLLMSKQLKKQVKGALEEVPQQQQQQQQQEAAAGKQGTAVAAAAGGGLPVQPLTVGSKDGK